MDGFWKGVPSSPTAAEKEPYFRVVSIRGDVRSSHSLLPNAGKENYGKVEANLQVPLTQGS